MSNTNSNPENKTPNPGTKDALKAENEALKAELEAAKAQAEKDAEAANAELEALKAQMANGDTADTEPDETAAPEDDRVELFIPRVSGNTDPNLIIVLNGKNYVLPKGQKSLVPKAVAAEYERSKRAQYKVDNAIFDMVEQSKQQAEKAGIK